MLNSFLLKSYTVMNMLFTVINGTIHVVTTGNTVNSCLTSTVVKIHHEPVIAPFSAQRFSLVTKLFFTVIDDIPRLCRKP